MSRELAHKIALDLTPAQTAYCMQACGTSRFVWNWGLNAWNEARARGEKPTGQSLKKAFNAIKYQKFPWLEDIHRDAHAQPFQTLGKAWATYFSARKAGRKNVGEPTFKKKGAGRDSFYVANDKFRVVGNTAVLPKIGEVRLHECLRFEGKILFGTVSRDAGQWFLSVTVEVSNKQYRRQRSGNGVIGVDLGVKHTATSSRGPKEEGPKPLKKLLKRVQKLGKSVSRKVEVAKTACGVSGEQTHPQVCLLKSKNRQKVAAKLAKTHQKIRNVRQDFLHKLTTRLCRENQAIGLETLNVAGMVQNRKLARAVSDIGMGELVRQLRYKAERYGTLLVFVDPWFPSSKRCSACKFVVDSLPLSVRTWTCPACGVEHDRDLNAAQNLEQEAWLALKKTLPAASGEVTPVRDEDRLQKDSGQELEPCTLLCT